ncbi:putative membrane protein [Weissella beninensis]|uniref:PTS sugar transporter subunit IIC n=1 Tax=Periweissella beninensis TaxID=504936 RepID=A0ABT0VKQ2_9LACO|nr:PTS sugar transporter subunit IIC [Periweissella beninensis]MBM7544490.1 putative membrane protein [Periweissella beninensis]MCM2437035.1 PTS sugar transporter subunit IIC [Periweissella beninensis]
MKQKPQQTFHDIILAVLNGNSFAIVVALIPSALLSQILKFLPQTPLVKNLEVVITLAQSALPLVAAFAVGMLLKFSMLEIGSLALATFVAAGNTVATANGFTLSGSGVILNIILTTLLGALITPVLHRVLGQLKMVFEPLLVLVIVGLIGQLTLPLMLKMQILVGKLVSGATNTQPLLMGVLLGVLFAILVVSPLSSVGIATAIGLSGVGAGAANAGIVACSFTLALIGASVNPLGVTLAHFIGSPKIQMANLLARPKIFIPTSIAAGLAGGVASLLTMHGTAFSAGFGFSGLIGPLTAWQTSPGSLLGLRVLITFVLVPVLLAFIMQFIFVKRLKLVEPAELAVAEL